LETECPSDCCKSATPAKDSAADIHAGRQTAILGSRRESVFNYWKSGKR
jgi:hypothetical protein